jgi:hypothetical protein
MYFAGNSRQAGKVYNSLHTPRVDFLFYFKVLYCIITEVLKNGNRVYVT